MSDEDSIPASDRAPQAMIAGFPQADRRVERAYAELDLAAGGGTLLQRDALGELRLLARPWDPATCVDPQLRAEIWQWLEQVVTWLNHEYVWDADAIIPACWPRHPHLVHELAVLADLRRRAGLSLSADALEEWHRYALPAFAERVRQRLRQHCQDGGHQPWPAQGRHTRHQDGVSHRNRAEAYEVDVDTLDALRGIASVAPPAGPGRPNLQFIDGNRVDASSREAID